MRLTGATLALVALFFAWRTHSQVLFYITLFIIFATAILLPNKKA